MARVITRAPAVSHFCSIKASGFPTLIATTSMHRCILIVQSIYEGLPPLVARELKSEVRALAQRKNRLKVAAATMLVLLSWLIFRQTLGSAPGGMDLLQFLTFAGCLVAVFAGATVSGEEFMRERQEGTLGLLLLAPLSARSIVAGKLAGNTLALLWTLLGMGPLIGLSLSLGGASASDCISASGLVISTAMLASAAGIRASIQSDTIGKAKARALSWFFLAACTGLLLIPVLAWKLWRSQRRLAIVRRGGKKTETGRARTAGDILTALLGAGLAAGIMAALWHLPDSWGPGTPWRWFSVLVFAGGRVPALETLFLLATMFLVSALIIELGSKELEEMRWSGKVDSSHADNGELMTAGSMPLRKDGGTSAEGRLLQPDLGATALIWTLIVMFGLRAFSVSETKMGLPDLAAKLGYFESSRFLLSLIGLPLAWQVCRGCISARRSGLWEMIRISPLSDAECLELLMKNTMNKLAWRPFIGMHCLGATFLVLLQLFSSNPPGWLTLAGYLLIGFRCWRTLEMTCWAALKSGLREDQTAVAGYKALLRGVLFPWLVTMITAPLFFLSVAVVGSLFPGPRPGVWILGISLFLSGLVVDYALRKKLVGSAMNLFKRPFDPVMLSRS